MFMNISDLTTPPFTQMQQQFWDKDGAVCSLLIVEVTPSKSAGQYVGSDLLAGVPQTDGKKWFPICNQLCIFHLITCLDSLTVIHGLQMFAMISVMTTTSWK